MSPDVSGESVYTGNCIAPMHRDESLRLRMVKEKCYVYVLNNTGAFYGCNVKIFGIVIVYCGDKYPVSYKPAAAINY
jgi:hypothetical protein